jgi:hypothetical protein
MEPAAVEQWAFHEQFHTFNQFGYAQDISSGNVVGDMVRGLPMTGLLRVIGSDISRVGCCSIRLKGR